MNPTDHPDLGELLFEKRPHSLAVAVPAIAAVVFACFGVVFLLDWTFGDQPNREERARSFSYGASACVGSVLLGLATFAAWKSVLRVYEAGVSHVTPTGSSSIRFDQIDSLSFRRNREYLHGAYVGTSYFFRFGIGGKSIYFKITLKKDIDTELEGVADLASRIVASRISEQLDTDGHAPWTNRLRLSRHGVEYLHQGDWRIVPYQSVGTCEVDGEFFYLRAKDSEFPLMRENTICENFFPGLIVLQEQAASAQSDAVEEG